LFFLIGGLVFGLSLIKPAQADDTPVITSIYPTSGPVGTRVSIYGENLGEYCGFSVHNSMWVYFGDGEVGLGNQELIISWTDTKIVVEVPEGAMTAPIRVGMKNWKPGEYPELYEVVKEYDITGPTFTVTEEAALTTKDLSFFSFDKNLRNGVNIAVGDLDRDGVEDIVVGAGQGSKPIVKVFDGQEHEILTDSFYAYSENFRGGVNVAVGDVDGDGYNEIVVGAGRGGGPHVRIFDHYGNVKYSGFFAFDKNFRGGVNVACGDVNGDGIDDIITGAGLGGGPHVRAFDRYGNAIRW